jgi:hypothetical protein
MKKPLIKKTLIERINSAADASLILWDAEGHQHRIDLEDLQAMAIGLDVCRTYHEQPEKHVFKTASNHVADLCVRCGGEQYDLDRHYTYEEARARRRKPQIEAENKIDFATGLSNSEGEY